MKPLSAGTASSCLIWSLLFGVLTICLCPIASFIGSFSSTVLADSVARRLEPYLCPDGSRAEIITFETSTRDEFGNERPATGFEMQCVDESGNIVRAPSPDYAFYWVGLLAAASLVASGLLSLLLAAPVGAFVTHRVRRAQKADSQ